MLTFSAALVTALEARDKDLRFTVEIAGFTNAAGITIVLASAPLVIAGQDVQALLLPIRDNSGRVDLDSFRASYAGVGFSVLDEGDFITSRLDDFTFVGKTVTVRIGTPTVAFSDYATLYQGIIQGMKLSADPRVYEFRTVDVQENLNQYVFVTAKAKLTVAIDADDTTLTVDDASGFALAGPFVNFEGSGVARGHVIVGTGSQAEIIEWRAKSSNNLQTLQRGQQGTTARSHAIGEDVFELVSWPGHPLEILSVISGATIEEPVAFASVPSTWKMGTAVVLNAAFWLLAKDRTRWAIWDYRTTEKLFARTFAEDEVLRPLSLFIRASVGNQLSLVPFIERQIPLEPARVLVRDQIGVAIEWDGDGERVSNRVTVDTDFDPTTGQYVESRTFNDTASQTLFGVRRPAAFQLKGLRGTSAQDQADIVAREHFILFAAVFPIVQFSAFLRQSDLEVGDPVKVTHPQLPKRQAGTRGEAGHFLKILERGVHFFGPDVAMGCYDADIPSSNLYGSLAVDGTASYPSATAAQQAERVFFNRSFRPA